LVALQEDFSRT